MMSTDAYLFVAGIDNLPCLVDLALKCQNGLLVLLAQLHSCLHLGCVGNDLCIELTALTYKALLIVCAAVHAVVMKSQCAMYGILVAALAADGIGQLNSSISSSPHHGIFSGHGTASHTPDGTAQDQRHWQVLSAPILWGAWCRVFPLAAVAQAISMAAR